MLKVAGYLYLGFLPLEKDGEHSSLLSWVYFSILLLMNKQVLQLWSLPNKFINWRKNILENLCVYSLFQQLQFLSK